MKVASSILALSAALALAPAAARADGVESFKDWTVVCDNLRNCHLAGFAPDLIEAPAVLRLSRDGAAGAPVRIEIDILDGEVDLRRGGLGLAIDGRDMPTVRAQPWTVSEGPTLVITDAQTGPLLGAARNGSLLSVRVGGKDVGQVSLAGMVAAMRYADDQQKRVGTMTAMIAKGTAPAASIPAPPPAPVLQRAPAVAQTGLPPKPPSAIQALIRKAECDVGPQWADEKPLAARLSADKVLWQVPCGGGAYNFSTLFVVVDKAGRVTLAPLEGVDDGLAMNAEYDPKTRILSAYNKGRGIGDCGNSDEWVWTGQAFALSKSAIMPECRGYGYDWPTVFQAEVR